MRESEATNEESIRMYNTIKELAIVVLGRSRKRKVHRTQLCARCGRAYKKKTGKIVQTWEIEQVLEELIRENPPKLEKDNSGNYSITEYARDESSAKNPPLTRFF